MSVDNEEESVILAKYFPAAAVATILDFFVSNPVTLRFVGGRVSKFGDFTPDNRSCRITLNNNLTPEFCLMVLLHEMAHYDVYVAFGWGRTKPHGIQWQSMYAKRLRQYISFFPREFQSQIAQLASSLPLSRSLLNSVEKALSRYGLSNEAAEPHAVLDSLPPGSRFLLCGREQYVFRSIAKRRTRWLCFEELSGRRFTVSGSAQVVELH